jgi:ribosomal protein L7Ae-like RNA K-turn-binding protein
MIREYVEQNKSKELDVKIGLMIQTLMAYQRQAIERNPEKAKLSKRLYFGLNEVKKSLKTKKAKAVIIATNIEESKTAGGLDDRVLEIIRLAKENNTPIMYSMTKRRLGKCGNKPNTACVSVVSGDGAHAELRETILMAEKLAKSWKNGVRTDEQDAKIAATTTMTTATTTAATTASTATKENNGERKNETTTKSFSLNPSAGEFTPSWIH